MKNLLSLIFVSPLLTFVHIFKLKSREQIVIWSTFLMGMVGSLTVYISGTDGDQHLNNTISHYSVMTISQFTEKLFEILSLHSTQIATDPYLHVISFISARIFNIPSLIHVITGFILGFFVSKSVVRLLDHNIFEQKTKLVLALIILLLSVRTFSALNSIRMWTAMWVLFYGTLMFVQNRRIKYFLIMVSCVFLHFSYIIVLVPVIISFFVWKRSKLVVAIYLVSYFLTPLNLSLSTPDSALLKNKAKYNVQDESNNVADIIAKRAQKSQTLNFYKRSGELFYVKYSAPIFSITLVFLLLFRKINNSLSRLISIGLILYAFGNLSGNSPSLQGRVYTISSLFILASTIITNLNYSQFLKSKLIQFLLWTGIILSIPIILFSLSDFLFTYSIFFSAFPIFSWALNNNDISLREFIGYIID